MRIQYLVVAVQVVFGSYIKKEECSTETRSIVYNMQGWIRADTCNVQDIAFVETAILSADCNAEKGGCRLYMFAWVKTFGDILKSAKIFQCFIVYN